MLHFSNQSYNARNIYRFPLDRTHNKDLLSCMLFTQKKGSCYLFKILNTTSEIHLKSTLLDTRCPLLHRKSLFSVSVTYRGLQVCTSHLHTGPCLTSKLVSKLRFNRETDEYEAFFCKYIILHSRGQTSK